MRRRLLLGGGPLMLGSLVWPQPLWARDQAFELVLKRVRDWYLSKSAGEVWSVASTLRSDGTWQDTNYSDKSLGNWLPAKHLDRLGLMALAYSQVGHKLNKDSYLLDQINRAVEGWRLKSPRSDNWWFNTIGSQINFCQTLVLMQDSLSLQNKSYLLAQLVMPNQVPPDRRTGQNLMWYATQQLVRGAILRSDADMLSASQATGSLLEFSSGEGLKEDGSFQQHGPQLYSAGYGLQFYLDSVNFCGWLFGTPWALSSAKLRRLERFGDIGIASVIRNDWIDWGSRGREFTRNEQRGRRAMEFWRGRQELKVLLGENPVGRKNKGEYWRGIHYFWQSEFLVSQSEEFYFSIKNSSSNTVGTESGNGENLQGYWLPFGSTFFARTGEEYLDILPNMDWSKIPGVTAVPEVPPLQGYQRNDADFACGLVDDGFSVLAMSTTKNGLTAHKAWFFDRSSLICAGTGIQTKSGIAHTTINQCRFAGSVAAKGRNIRASEVATAIPPRTPVFHDGVDYLSLDDKDIYFELGAKPVDANRINSANPVKGLPSNVIRLWIAHEKNGAGEDDYLYMVQPRNEGVEIASAARKFEIISNKKHLQMISWPSVGLTMGATRGIGLVTTSFGVFEIPQNCVFLIRGLVDKRVRIVIALPTGRSTMQAISIKKRAEGGSESSVKLVREIDNANQYSAVF